MTRLVATCVAAGLGVTVLAQEVRVPQQPVFKSGVDLVTLDVSVLDSERRPIKGLGPADFTILENGQPQNVAVFSAVEIPDVEPPKTTWLRDVAPDVRTNDDNKERRLFLIIVDDATVEGDIYALKQLKELTINVINRFGPSDLAAVVFTMDNRKSVDFTSDRARLLNTVGTQPMGFSGMSPTDPAFTDKWYQQASIDVVRRSVELRTAANVGALAASGSLYYDVDVPDFSSADVSLSGLVLTATPSLPAGGVKPVLPVMPTTQRRFGAGVEVAAFFRVYAGGKAPAASVPVRIRVRNDEDLTVLDRREIIDAGLLTAERFANVNVPLPISRLPAGEYLLTVETNVGKIDIMRSLRFAVSR